MVADGPTRVVDLAGRLPVSRPAVSKHLRLLSAAGLVTAQPSGREIHYALDPAGLQPVLSWLDDLGRRPPVLERTLDALDLEVRRTVRERPTETQRKETA